MKSTIIIAGVYAALLMAPSVRAAELLVPGGHATIGAAVAAASAGDTIRITNSAGYAESLSIDKSITIEAAAGQTPSITGDGVTTHVLRTLPGAGGAKIGSSSGGQITLNCQSSATIAAIVSPQHPSGTVTFENLRFQNINTATDLVIPSSSGNCTFREIASDGGARGFDLTAPSAATITGAQLRLEKCIITNLAAEFLRQTGGSINLTIDQSYIHSLFVVWYVTSTAAGNSFTCNYSFLSNFPTNTSSGQGPGATCNLTNTPGVTIDWDHVAVVSNRHCLQIYGGNNWTLTMDHCDLHGDIDGDSNHTILATNDATGRTVSVTNTTFVSNGTSIGWGDADSNTSNDVSVTGNYNNFVRARGPNAPAGANDITSPVTPNYVAPATGNFLYTSPELITAGSGATPIGTMQDFMNLNIVPPVNRARNWLVY